MTKGFTPITFTKKKFYFNEDGTRVIGIVDMETIPGKFYPKRLSDGELIKLSGGDND